MSNTNNSSNPRSTPPLSLSTSPPSSSSAIPRQLSSPLRHPFSSSFASSSPSRPSSSPPSLVGSGIPPPGLFSLPSPPSFHRPNLSQSLRSGVLSAYPPTSHGNSSRPTSSGGPSSRNRVASTAAATRLAQGEWSFFGIDIPIGGVRHLAEEASSAFVSSSVGDLGRRSNSAHGDKEKELFHTAFGGDRWKLEIVKAAPAPTSPISPNPSSAISTPNSKLSLFLFLDMAYQPVYDTKLMFGIREPNEAIGKRESREGWLWRTYEDHCFGSEQDYYQCDNFPSFEELMRNPRVSELDSFVLSIQIQSPGSSPLPQLEELHHVPLDLYAGLSSLLDDKSTGDVIIYAHERQPTSSPSASGINITSIHRSIGEDKCLGPAFYRKRTLYAHGAILKNRSAYFRDLLSDGWAETCGGTGDERQKARVKIEDFDYTTVYWLLHFLYTNQITFQPTEDVRLLPPDCLPEGWLSNPERISWEYFPLASLSPQNSKDLGHISETTETEGSDPDDQISSSPTISAKAAGKRRTTPLPTIPPPSSSKRRPTTPDIPPSSPSSAAGRISPLGGGGRISPTSSRTPRRSHPQNESDSGGDPHPHPPTSPTSIPPASALAIYKLAHRYSLPVLANLALCHLIQTLTPRTAFPLLLSTYLWPDLHGAIKSYAYSHYFEILREKEFGRCYGEVGEGLWENGGEVLLEFTMNLTPAWLE